MDARSSREPRTGRGRSEGASGLPLMAETGGLSAVRGLGGDARKTEGVATFHPRASDRWPADRQAPGARRIRPPPPCPAPAGHRSGVPSRPSIVNATPLGAVIDPQGRLKGLPSQLCLARLPRQNTKVDIGAEPIFGPKTQVDSEVVAGLRQAPLEQKGSCQIIMLTRTVDRYQQSSLPRRNLLSGVIQAAIHRKHRQSRKIIQQQAMEKHIASTSLSQDQPLITNIKKSDEIQGRARATGQEKSQG